MEKTKLKTKQLLGSHLHGHPSNDAERFVEYLKDEKFCGKIIELGIGSGINTDYFRKQGFKCIGVDVDNNAIIKAKISYPVADFRHSSNGWRLTEADESVDAFFVKNFNKSEEAADRLLEIRRCLKPDGILFIQFYLPSSLDELGKSHIEEEYINRLMSYFKLVKRLKYCRLRSMPTQFLSILEFIVKKNKY
ncbi:hypothetical protein CVU83_01170 [Candidatus Falkowbacteria bacterium HGW-Falkowbacteria-2]|uniref:Methyltransferase type 11 domain-containing protein n=1 Tax=Candidatus Falkowbacteria bacterium HGW-Falkowbacteria-2 TaxID=2013769 RepID=A0A2N2E1Z4_9BACT|nr:MAG: hypothetical protein CVU83_01170 [Candidatus Falkowbacteria bacterium HGW-Falkowbacteria-2]